MDFNFISGQLLMIGFHGCELNDDVMELIRSIKPSGIILFRRNIVDPFKLFNFIRDVQRYALEHGLPPLIVSIDYEGGVVLRIERGATILPSFMGISANRRVSSVRIVARIAARELKAMGVNMNLAPVLDVNTNPVNPIIGVRSFGDDPLEVAVLGKAYIEELQSHGIMAVAKHFPGHGDTSIDSHLDLPILDLSLEDMLDRELVPFRAAIEAGVSSIMTAHIAYPKIDESGLPATLSRKIIADLLRSRLGFNGVVMTDALEMKAIYDRFEPREIAELAINAGVDLLLVSGDYNLMCEVKEAIWRGLESGIISKSRVLESINRINSLKERFGLHKWRFDESSLNIVGCSEHVSAINQIFSNSIVVVKNEGVIPLPIHVDSIGILIPDVLDRRLLRGFGAELIESVLKDRCGDVVVASYPVNPELNDVRRAISLVDNCSFKVLFTYNALLNKGQIDLVNETGDFDRLVVVASRDPYDLMALGGVKCYVAVFGFLPPLVEPLFKVLFGEAERKGGLPVNINGFKRSRLHVD